jgi:hypothetical protein
MRILINGKVVLEGKKEHIERYLMNHIDRLLEEIKENEKMEIEE